MLKSHNASCHSGDKTNNKENPRAIPVASSKSISTPGVTTPVKKDSRAFIAQSVALYQKGQIREALEVVIQGLAVDPDNVDLLNHKGVFSVRLGDAVAAEAAYRRAISVKPDIAANHYNLGNLLKTLKRLDEAEEAYRGAIAVMPDYAEAYSNLGNLLKEQQRLEEAETAYRRAIALMPDCADTHMNLGVLLKNQKRLEEAEVTYRCAIAVKPNDAELYSDLGVLLVEEKRLEEAEAAYHQAIALKPDYAEAYSNLGNLLQAKKYPDESEVTYRRAITLKPDFVEAYWNLSLLLLKRGRFMEGWREYEARYDPAKKDRSMSPPPTLIGGASLPPQWQGESLQDKVLLIWPEQGLGDEIQFVRYLPLLKARGLKHLTLACKPPLKTLFAAQSLADRVISIDDWRPEMAAEFDYWCYPLSLPLHFQTTLDNLPATIPYLTSAPDRIEHWSTRLPQAAFRIGLVWKGRPTHKNDTNRSLPSLTTLVSLWSLPGIAFISLQKGSGEDEACDPPVNQPLIHLGSEIADFADAAAILSQLDLLICVDTATAHLAGALGVPCWVLLPDYGTDWRWLEERTDSPWYPQVMRLFRQTSNSDWDSVVACVVDELKEMMDA